MKRLRLGLFSFTADEGCMIVFEELFNKYLFEWKDLLEIKSARVLQTKSEIKDIDVAFVEGCIATNRDMRKLREIRKNSKRVVALGNCAVVGEPSNHRNHFDRKRLKEIEMLMKRFKHLPKMHPIKDFISVDKTVPGCPVSDKQILDSLNEYLKEFGVHA